jgi:hypothetical protein
MGQGIEGATRRERGIKNEKRGGQEMYLGGQGKNMEELEMELELELHLL